MPTYPCSLSLVLSQMAKAQQQASVRERFSIQIAQRAESNFP